MNDEPSEAMSEIGFVPESDFDTTANIAPSDTKTRVSPTKNFPMKNSGLWAIRQSVSHFFKRKHHSEPYEQEKENRDGQPHAGRTDEDKAREHRQAVDHGLRELAKWEQRIVSGSMRRRRR